MVRKYFCFIILCSSIAVFGQGNLQNSSKNYEGIISNYKQLTLQQLIDTASYFYSKNSYDTALVYYNLIINTPVKSNDIEQKKIVIRALNQSAIVYANLCNYRTSFELFLRALSLCEKIENVSFKPTIYNNIGFIYDKFNRFDIAKDYFIKALSLCGDSASMVIFLNNLGDNAIKREKIDSAFYWLNQSLRISKQHDNFYINVLLSSIADAYIKAKQYDSAFHYLKLSVSESRKVNNQVHESESLSKLGNLFFDVNKIDSALYYIDLSNLIAAEKKFIKISADNYLILSKIEESKGRTAKAFEYFKSYAHLKDSVYGFDQFSEINQLQRLYEVSKTNQQMEQLMIEQQINERTIQLQKIIQVIAFAIILIISVALCIILLQKRELKKAYKTLFDKNIEIVEIESVLSEVKSERKLQSNLTDEKLQELLDKILVVMDDKPVIFDPEFDVDKLAELTKSNQSYISQVINIVFNKNFRSFLNSYRIKEAQRLLSEPDAKKFTIEFVANSVGFKSRSTFYETFKDIVGVSPKYYLKSMQIHATAKN